MVIKEEPAMSPTTSQSPTMDESVVVLPMMSSPSESVTIEQEFKIKEEMLSSSTQPSKMMAQSDVETEPESCDEKENEGEKNDESLEMNGNGLVESSKSNSKPLICLRENCLQEKNENVESEPQKLIENQIEEKIDQDETKNVCEPSTSGKTIHYFYNQNENNLELMSSIQQHSQANSISSQSDIFPVRNKKRKRTLELSESSSSLSEENDEKKAINLKIFIDNLSSKKIESSTKTLKEELKNVIGRKSFVQLSKIFKHSTNDQAEEIRDESDSTEERQRNFKRKKPRRKRKRTEADKLKAQVLQYFDADEIFKAQRLRSRTKKSYEENSQSFFEMTNNSNQINDESRIETSSELLEELVNKPTNSTSKHVFLEKLDLERTKVLATESNVVVPQFETNQNKSDQPQVVENSVISDAGNSKNVESNVEVVVEQMVVAVEDVVVPTTDMIEINTADDDVIIIEKKVDLIEIDDENDDSSIVIPLCKVIKTEEVLGSEAVLQSSSNQNANSIEIFSQSPSEEAPNPAASHLPQPLITEREPSNRLRPWLSCIDSKHSKAVAVMLKEQCLLSTFKCMGALCEFYTKDSQSFLCHLEMHENFQCQDAESFKRCSYCDFKGTDSENLLVHLETVHGNDKFVCLNCFYRSIAPGNVTNHAIKFHNNDTLTTYNESDIKCLATFGEQLEEAKGLKTKNVRPISCAGKFGNFIIFEKNNHKCLLSLIACKQKFHIYKEFISHFKEQNCVINAFECNKCKEKITLTTYQQHLENCYNIARYQCAFCRKGFKNTCDVTRHLADRHSSNFPVYWERKREGNDSVQLR
jgi:hypothetical protein